MTTVRALFGRGAVGRAALSSLFATGSDYAVFGTFVYLGTQPGIATLVGCLIGAVVNFSINRYWAFGGGGAMSMAVARYATVSAASAVTNAALVGLATAVVGLSATPAWLLVRALVFLGLTYPLFRQWVFGETPRIEGASAPAAIHGTS